MLDRGFGWFGRLVGDRAEIDESAAARAERARGWTSRTILIAALLMLVFNARALQSWASTLPPQWGTETLRLVAGEWAGRLQDAGFDEPRRRAHAAYETTKTLDWKGGVGRSVDPGYPPPTEGRRGGGSCEAWWRGRRDGQ